MDQKDGKILEPILPSKLTPVLKQKHLRIANRGKNYSLKQSLSPKKPKYQACLLVSLKNAAIAAWQHGKRVIDLVRLNNNGGTLA